MARPTDLRGCPRLSGSCGTPLQRYPLSRENQDFGVSAAVDGDYYKCYIQMCGYTVYIRYEREREIERDGLLVCVDRRLCPQGEWLVPPSFVKPGTQFLSPLESTTISPLFFWILMIYRF